MNFDAAGTTAWATFGVPGVEVAVLVALAVLAQHRAASAQWRRTIWQAGFVAIAAVLLLELNGGGRAWIERSRPSSSAEGPLAITPPSASPDQPQALDPLAGIRTPLPPAEPALPALEFKEQAVTPVGVFPSPVAVARPSPADPAFLGWFVGVWFGGTLVLVALKICARLSVAIIRRRSRTVANAELLRRMTALPRKLRMRRTIRLLESAKIPGPVATGILRPAIVLPLRFAENHSPEEQDVILLHEAAHLAAWDPA